MARAKNTLKIRKGDLVQIIAGNDKGHKGIVEHVDVEKGRVVVEGANIIKRHTKARPVQNAADANKPENQGGVIQRSAPVHVSNVAIVSPGSDKPSRVGFRLGEDGRKIRVARKDNVDLDETKGR